MYDEVSNFVKNSSLHLPFIILSLALCIWYIITTCLEVFSLTILSTSPSLTILCWSSAVSALQKMVEQIPFNIIADVLTKLGLLGYLTNWIYVWCGKRVNEAYGETGHRQGCTSWCWGEAGMVQSRSIGHWLGGSRGVSVSVYRFGIRWYVK